MVKQVTLGRLIWLAAIALPLSLFAFTVPLRYEQLVMVAAENEPYLAQIGLTTQFLLVYLVTLDTVTMLAFGLIAAAIVWRKSGDWLARLVSAMLVLMGVLLTRPVESLADVAPVWHLPFALTLAMGVSAIVLFMFIFPDGRFAPSWSRWLVAGWIIWDFAWYLTPMVLQQPPPWPPSLQPAWAVTGWIGSGLVIQVYRFRAVSTPAQRQQTKWVIIGLIASALGFLLYLYFAPALLPALLEPGLPHLFYILAGVPVLYVSLLLLPVAIGVSILRYRLWDVGVLVNRTLVYGALTVLLTAVYLAFVLVLQPFFHALTGQDSLLTMAASTLGTAVLVYPLRQRVQASIDRRLFPRKYDAQQTLTALSAILRDEVDLTRLTEALEGAIGAALQPASVFSWLRTAAGFRVYLFDDMPPVGQTAVVVDGEVRLEDPLVGYLESAASDVAVLDRLELASPAKQRLTAASVTILMLLRSRGELIGWVSLGPRLNGQGYSADELNFLALVAAQAGPAVRVAQLAQEQQAAALERQRLDQQLHVARLVQQTLLPQRHPNLPGWRIMAHYQPAQAVGGDFYDFLTFQDGRFGLIIGDVSDKGIPAALLMAATRSLLRSVAYQLVAPAAVLQQANQMLIPDLPLGLFVTCLYAVLDPVNGRLTLANAGHNPPCHRTNGRVSELWLTGMPLGWLPSARYEEREITLAPGDCLFLYSDGLTEALNAQGELFGTPRLKELLRTTTDTDTDLISRLLAQVAAFSGPDGVDDDVAIVTLQREAVTVAASSVDDRLHRGEEWRLLTTFALPSVPGNDRVAMERVATAVQGLNLPEERLAALKTAVAETALNGIEHGNGYQPELLLWVEVLVSTTAVRVRITDQGSGLYEKPPTPDLAAKLAGEQSPRGWGLFLIENMVDAVRMIDDEEQHTVELTMNGSFDLRTELQESRFA